MTYAESQDSSFNIYVSGTLLNDSEVQVPGIEIETVVSWGNGRASSWLPDSDGDDNGLYWLGLLMSAEVPEVGRQGNPGLR